MLNGHGMDLRLLREKLETLQSSVPRDNHQTSAEINEIMIELRQLELLSSRVQNATSNTAVNREHRQESGSEEKMETASASKDSNLLNSFATTKIVKDAKQARKGQRTFPEKVFQTRDSYLTTLLEVDHMRTIYHIFYVIFIIFLINNIVYEYIVNRSISFGLGTFKIGFSKLHYVLCVWMLQMLFVLSIYYAVKVWRFIRFKLEKKKSLQHLWSLACLSMYIASQVIFIIIPAQLCLRFHFPYVTGSVLVIETLRMFMKMHSFVRTTAARIVKGKDKLDDEEDVPQAIHMPSFGKYVYFLFAPTLLYRDNYPRTTVIRWKFASARLMEVVVGSFFYSYIYENHIKYHFGNFGIEEISAASVTIKIFGMLMPSIFIFLFCFYMILHSWLNFTSEILRFGDRLFYSDWWTAGNYDTYYRTWNIVVHDWLYEYIYKDFYTYVFKGSKLASSLTVFLISAIFHEYMIGFALQLFFPIMFIFFAGVGVSMVFVTRLLSKRMGNILIWLSLIYGNCLMVSLYCMEYFTSRNIPRESYDKWSDILVPHLWSCYFEQT